MSVISEKYLSEMLYERFDYKSNDIEVTVKELMKMSDDGKDILREYLESGVLPQREKNGLSLKMMREQASSEMTDVSLIIVYDGIQKKITDSKK